MDILKKIKGFLNPYSVEGLRLRISKLPDCPYTVLLTLCANQLEAKRITELDCREAVAKFRLATKDSIASGLRLLKLTHKQYTEVLALLSTGKIKDVSLDGNKDVL